MSEVENAVSQQPAAEQPAQTATPVASTDLGVAANRPNGSLYVGNLSPEVDEQVLYPLFSQVGQINSIRVCRDVISRRSLGYAYVNFNVQSDPSSAQKALDTLNYHLLLNKPIRIMWSSRDPTSRKHGAGNLFVKNLAKSIDHKELHRIFSEFGDISSLKISQDDNSVSRGYGFVHFKKEEDAKKAMEALNNKDFDGKPLAVQPFVRRDDRSSGRKNTNVYVKFLPENVDEGRLREICTKYGEITSVKIERDEKGASKKFGYINFKTTSEAEQAINGLKAETIDGQQGLYAAFHEAKVERAQLIKRMGEEKKEKRNQDSADKNVYVKFLPENFDDTKLKELFSPFGVINSVKVATTTDGISRGFGFVCFASASDASTAISKMNRTKIEGKPLHVCLSQRKEVRINQQARLGQRYIPTVFPPTGYNMPFPWPYPLPPFYNQYDFYSVMHNNGRGNRFNHHGHGGRGFRNGGRGNGGRGHANRQYFTNPAGQKGVYQGQRNRNNQGGRTRQQTVQAPSVPVEAVVPAVAVAEAVPVDVAAPPPVVEEAGAVEIETFTAASLVDRSPEEQKRIIGNKLYLQIQNIFNTTVTTQYPLEEVCGKITGMLLEMSVDELLMLIDSNETLTEQVQAAHELLLSNNFMANEGEVAN
uniref:Polyadenylate-binding protein n=1 Tax=Polytomella parva TaxID=51329 RepID=A0A7S0UN68_9CHLO|mmetsp:Transcript_1165/g.1711  ORF Transcript_1165/g.1711 Transcript_1165/m.1711 type:complete len:647 (+) Transcript_1165:212-2152(+)